MSTRTKATKTATTKAMKAKPAAAASKIPAGALTIKEACAFFGVGHMTIFNWRRGTARKTQLPFHTVARGEREEVYFKPAELRAWAKKNSVTIAAK
ncbi:MAG: DNA-binding protein [Desulfurellales bacterium]|nr:MAG: DNA-binding protein [Desulfurellales bacterium]